MNSNNQKCQPTVYEKMPFLEGSLSSFRWVFMVAMVTLAMTVTGHLSIVHHQKCIKYVNRHIACAFGCCSFYVLTVSTDVHYFFLGFSSCHFRGITRHVHIWFFGLMSPKLATHNPWARTDGNFRRAAVQMSGTQVPNVTPQFCITLHTRVSVNSNYIHWDIHTSHLWNVVCILTRCCIITDVWQSCG